MKFFYKNPSIYDGFFVILCYNKKMTWAAKRRLQYLSGFFAFIFLILFWIFYPIIFVEPTCSDGKKNGKETGIDCGGMCSIVCKHEAYNPVVLWSRAFNITGSAYNLVAYVENSNIDSALKSASYEFRIYDENNNIIGTKKGSTFLPSNGKFFIFGPRFDSGNSKVKSVVFDFTSELVWYKSYPTINKLPIYVNNVSFESDINSSALKATINNDSIYNIFNFDIIAVLYDVDGNAINASKTFKDKLLKGNKSELVFTWPKGIEESTVIKKEITFLVNPFETEF